MVISGGGAALPLEVGPLGLETAGDGRRVLRGLLRFSGREPLAPLSIRCEPLADLGMGHRTLARIARGSVVEPFVFADGVTFQQAPERAAQGGGAFLRLGVLHIFTGYDHVAFLVALLLLGGSVAEVLKIATSFTVAHSVTLSLAALGAMTLPTRLIEAGIAFSIAYVALENLLRQRPERRWLVSFAFGLVHGFGFANVLSEMNLPRAALASSLFLFNAGVEVGQVAIVLAVFPLLAMLRRTRAHQTLVTAASAAILVTGLFWLWQRAL
jgi:hydrogenase/urease accessory protein HupE